jgi:tRNA (mo5U34)-methyltransferase
MDLRPFAPFFGRLAQTRLAPWRAGLERATLARLAEGAHGDLARWESALAGLPALPPGRAVLDRPEVGTEPARDLSAEELGRLRQALMTLHPWRKGPYAIHGVTIDTEWRSDWKWDRLAPAIAPLAGRLVLDVGCGNGYHAWRMLGAGARLVLGIDPTLVFALQFLAVNRYLDDPRLGVLPIALEDLPEGLSGFDTVFSMGVLYHRRDPALHLDALSRLLRPGGELVLETLVLPGEGEGVLRPAEVPGGRYAGMRNCRFVPTVESLRLQVAAAGFAGLRLVDRSPTTVSEQRTTDWMRFQSLADRLDPADRRLTLEGHPAPTRAILLAHSPG